MIETSIAELLDTDQPHNNDFSIRVHPSVLADAMGLCYKWAGYLTSAAALEPQRLLAR